MSAGKQWYSKNFATNLIDKVTKFFKRCWLILAFFIITAAIISSLFRALTPWAKQYKTELEHHLSSMLGEAVTIDTLETGWYWFEPVIKLNQVSITEHGKQDAVKLTRLLVGINLLSSFWHWQIQPGVLFIDDLHLSLHQMQEGWQIDGIDHYNSAKISWDAAKPILAWIFAQQKIIVKNLSIDLHRQDGSFIPLNELNLKILNRAGHYTIKGRGNLAQPTVTNFQLLAELTLNPYALTEASGQVFFSVQHLLPVQWQDFIGQPPLKLLDGKADVQLWADLVKGQLQNLQARLRTQNLTWLNNTTQKTQVIQKLNANLAWKPTKEGWELGGDQVHLRLEGLRWPENRFKLIYHQSEKAYVAFVHHILLESLLAVDFRWPQIVAPIIAMKPHGQLHDTQIHITNAKLDSLLTRFAALGWQAQAARPGADNLAGALHWQPDEGRMELAGENAVFNQANQSPVVFSAIHALFNWQALSEGLRIDMADFTVNHPNLLLHLSGVFDKITANDLGEAVLKGKFSAKQAQQLLAYLPASSAKPKLDAWLKHDIKRIEKAEGTIYLQGPLRNFPFDKQPGEFLINSHLSGVDLAFATNWPITKHIEAYLRINKRELEADIMSANLQGIKANQGNLRISDLGLDKEVLLIRSKANSSSERALAYVMTSPLRQKLSTLAMLKIQGLLALNLQLEAPLYPENDVILVRGDLKFKNNTVHVHHSMNDIKLNRLNGTLQFDEKGILDSSLTALIFNNPIKLAIQSLHKPVPSTQVKMTGKLAIDKLNEKFNLPLFSLMHGAFDINGVLKLTEDPNDFDLLRIQSSLVGLHIDLPPPFGKKADLETPLTFDLEFNPQQAMRLNLNYGNQLISKLWFSHAQERFELKKGQIRLGNREIKNSEQQKGLQLVGILPYFDLEQWLKIKAKLPAQTANSTLIDSLSLIDIQLDKAKIWQDDYEKFHFKAAKLKDDDWFIQAKQALLAARLHYRPSSNTITGQFDKLHLVNKTTNLNHDQQPKPRSTLKPTDLPNLDLHIASFQWGTVNLGSVNLKTKSTPNRWRLDYCKIGSPAYLLTVKGEWKQGEQANTTKLQANLHIDDLAASLQRWQISPAVEAQKGDLWFQGGWSGALNEFALAKINGEVVINFKEGRITSLSQETEEKLGLGKLLSILSLQTIPRRLKLDFSDLSKGGYSFDQFQGNFAIINGVMTTQNSYIDGPVAYAAMKGSLDIAKQLYDVDLKISPHITASLPVVATIAGGPVAGVATWVISKIINQGMQKISGYSYRISGPWQQPKVEEVSIVKKRLAALARR